MSRSKERNFPFTFTIENDDLEAARAAFFNPENAYAELDTLFDNLWIMADGEEDQFTQKNPKIIQTLKYIFSQINEAQRFNENYLGHMLSEPSIPGLYAYMMALRVNSNTVAREVSVVESELEPEAIKWMAELIGYDPEKASGTFTSGGSLANMQALWVAREKAVKKNDKGSFQGKYVIIASPFIHYSIDKAARILGGPNHDIEVVKAGSQNLAIDPEQLQQQISEILEENALLEEEISELERSGSEEGEIERLKKQLKEIMAIVSIAGETETGVVDPLDEISKVSKEHGLYHHVDAAYGLPYILSSRGSLFEGINEADSVTFDPHKALYTPYSAGAVIFKDPEDHGLTNFDSDDAAYVFKPGEHSLGQKRIEGSMGAGPILSTLAVIQSMEAPEFKALFDHTLNNVEYLYDRLLVSPVLMPIHTPDLNVLCFTVRTDICEELGITTHEELMAIIEKAKGRLNNEEGYFFSATNLPIDESVQTLEPGASHLPVFRAVLMHPRTKEEQIDKAIELLEEIILEN
jgi:glutamate decarboxylase